MKSHKRSVRTDQVHLRPSVALIGFMGCGKSSVARALAGRLHLHAYDLDHLIEVRERTTIAQIFSSRGENAFREIETKVLSEALQEKSEPGIIATGGGVVNREENRAILQAASARGVLVVYIKASTETLAERIRRQPGLRPLIDGERVLNMEETRDRVEEILKIRAPLYEESANFIVESGASSASEIAAKIAGQWSLQSHKPGQS